MCVYVCACSCVCVCVCVSAHPEHSRAEFGVAHVFAGSQHAGHQQMSTKRIAHPLLIQISSVSSVKEHMKHKHTVVSCTHIHSRSYTNMHA